MLSVQDIIKLAVLLDNDGLEAIKLLLLRLRLMKFPKIFEQIGHFLFRPPIASLISRDSEFTPHQFSHRNKAACREIFFHIDKGW